MSSKKEQPVNLMPKNVQACWEFNLWITDTLYTGNNNLPQTVLKMSIKIVPWLDFLHGEILLTWDGYRLYICLIYVWDIVNR